MRWDGKGESEILKSTGSQGGSGENSKEAMINFSTKTFDCPDDREVGIGTQCLSLLVTQPSQCLRYGMWRDATKPLAVVFFQLDVHIPEVLPFLPSLSSRLPHSESLPRFSQAHEASFCPVPTTAFL